MFSGDSRDSFRRRVRLSRRQILSLLILTVAVVTVAAGLLHPGEDDFLRYHNQTFRVVRVVDGDTLLIDKSDGRQSETRIRLWGVDTPETVDPRKTRPDYFGPEASQFSKKLAEGQNVRIELLSGRTRDNHDRLLAYVYLPDNQMLNERIIETGHGYADWRFPHPRMQRFLKLEERSAKAKLGLWANVHVDQMPGWRQETQRPAAE